MKDTRRDRTLTIWSNGSQVGTWTVNSKGVHSFQYADSWLGRQDACALSISLPLPASQTRYTGERVENFFDNLLPDTPEVRRTIRERYQLPSTAPFDLLSAVGKDCIGAIQLLGEGEIPGQPQQVEGRELSESDIAGLLRYAGRTGGFSSEDDEFRISLAGSQEKTALLLHNGVWKKPLHATPTTHIFKLPLENVGRMNADLSLSLENEWLCSEILRESRMNTAKSEILHFEEVKTLSIERFDRTWKDGGLFRVPQEDFCQVTGTSVENTYQSEGGPGIEEIMEFLRGSSQAGRDREMFFAAQLFFWILAAPDGHAKNFSVRLEKHNLFHLTPLYDVISAYPVLGKGGRQIAPQKLKLAMAISGKNRQYHWDRITLRHFRETAARCGISCDPVAEKVIRRMKQALPVVHSKLPSDFPTSVSEPIFSGIENQLGRLEGYLLS